MAPDQSTAIFLNEGAGGGRTDRVRRAVDLTRRALDADLHVIETRDVDELSSWLGERLERYATGVMVGGDGSLATAYNVAAGREDLTLGWIPAGFGNATAHLLNMPGDPEGVAEVLARRDARPIDLVAVGDRLALFAGAGWDALVAGRYAEGGAHRLRGWATAIASSVPDLWRRPGVEVVADGWTVHRGPIEMVVASTTPFYGRGLRVNPGARTDAGTVALRIYPGPAPRLAIEAARWVAGVRPHADRIDVREITLRSLDGADIPVQADGDVIGSRPSWTFAVRPAAVRLIGRWG